MKENRYIPVYLSMLILMIAMLTGCIEEPKTTAPSQERVIPGIITSLTLTPNFNMFNLDLLCKAWDDYSNLTIQRISMPFMEVIDYDIHLINEEKRYNNEYVELRRFYLPETRMWSLGYESDLSKLINLTSGETECTIRNTFRFNYTYYDGSNMIKRGDFSCISLYDYYFRCFKHEDGWKCLTFKNGNQEPSIYDSNRLIMECMEDRIRVN